MKRTIAFTPAYDHRGKTPDYGQHPMHLAFIVRGDKGAIVFDILTGWYIDSTQREAPRVWGLNAHDEVLDPHFDESELHENCDWLEGNPCISSTIYGFTGKPLDKLFNGFLAHGEEWLFTKLEAIYAWRHDGATEPEYDA